VLPVCIRSGARERLGQLQLIAWWREQHKKEMSKVLGLMLLGLEFGMTGS
jgi:hypothetical protein